MRKTEQKLWDRFRGNCHSSSLQLRRLENEVDEGWPDVHSIAGADASSFRESWIELKAVDAAPARSTTPLLGEADGLRPAQRNWFHEYRLHGGRRGFVLIGVGPRINLLLSANYHDTINRLTLQNCFDLAVADSWPSIIRALKS